MPHATPKLTSADRLRHLVEARIAESPYQCEGHQWAAEPQKWYAEQLGLSDRMIRKLLNCAPFVRKRRNIEGKVTPTIRIGIPDEKSEDDYVNHICNIWRKQIGRRVAKSEYGMVRGLVQHWPKGKAVDIFVSVLNNWDMFMAGVKHQLDLHSGKHRYFKYPTSSVTLRFYAVAVETHMTLLQQQGKPDKAVDLWVNQRDTWEANDALWEAGQAASAKAAKVKAKARSKALCKSIGAKLMQLTHSHILPPSDPASE